ncbi:MAG: redox-sensing transcriptional repressor Rex [Clostridia bacterium]|nr:redox-sensing transcriptional repressor Rex [Clostridia bacterium]
MAKRNARISNAVIKRLPRYRRYLYELKKKNVEKISSQGLSELIGYTASQIRQDLNHFGDFGQQGYGYSVDGLYDEIGAILGLDKEYKVVVVGIGHLGKSIARFTYLYKSGFKICGLFDTADDVIGKTVRIPVMDVKRLVDFVEENKVDIGIICVPPEAAQEVCDKLCFAGIKGIWNFAPVDLEAPAKVVVENVHVMESLHTLVYRMNEK